MTLRDSAEPSGFDLLKFLSVLTFAVALGVVLQVWEWTFGRGRRG